MIKLADKYILDWNNGGTEWTFEEIDVIRQYVKSRFPGRLSRVLFAYDFVEKEFTRGHRCRVCGRTQAQNKEIGYDCAHEC